MSVSPSMSHILLLDGDQAMRAQVAETLVKAGYRVTAFGEFDDALHQMSRHRHDAVIAALEWPDSEADKRVRTLRKHAGQAPLMLLCPPGRVGAAVEAMRRGADDYLQRPPDPFELKARLGRILDRDELGSRIAFFQDELSKRAGAKTVEAHSPTMRAVLDRVLRVAPMRSTVLIRGESGVGKELVARSLHFSSPRQDEPFIALNCAAIPATLIESELFGHERGAFTGATARGKGKFEIAHRGTLFLDEIGEMSASTQAKLLRVLEEREFMRVGGDQSIKVDVRVIAATNADLEELVTEQKFRQDLYYRLKVVSIAVPPLRERREDIAPLVERFLSELSRENAVETKVVSAGALQVLQDHEWPGNVRELKNLLESMLVSVPGTVIRPEHLPRNIRRDRSPDDAAALLPGTTLAEMERELIRRTLEHTGGNRTHSASLLGIGVRTLQRKIQSYGITIAPKRRRPRRRRANNESSS